MKFGIFYIPKGNFFELGSNVVGYNIRNEKIKTLSNIDHNWIENISPFGFHMTITDIVEIEESQLKKLEDDFIKILSCLPEKIEYNLSLKNIPISFWPKNKNRAALKFNYSSSLLMLHTILVCLLQKQGKYSYYTELLNKHRYNRNEISKINFFHSPYIFDEFKPHFSLLGNYCGDKSEIINYLLPLFSEYKQISINSLCIVTAKGKDPFFKIYKEIPLR